MGVLDIRNSSCHCRRFSTTEVAFLDCTSKLLLYDAPETAKNQLSIHLTCKVSWLWSTRLEGTVICLSSQTGYGFTQSFQCETCVLNFFEVFILGVGGKGTGKEEEEHSVSLTGKSHIKKKSTKIMI